MRSADNQAPRAPIARKSYARTPEGAEAWLRDVDALFRAGQTAEALREGAALDRVWPGQPAILHLLALIAKAAGYRQAAELHLRRAVALAPADAQILNSLANLLCDTGRGDEGIALFHRVTALVPSFVEAWINLGLAEEAGDELGAARDAYVGALRAQPGNAKAWLSLGLLCRRIGAWDDAEAAIAHALSIDSEYRRARLAAARLALDRGEPQAALATLAGSEDGTELLRAAAEHALGEEAGAIARVQRASDATPTDPQPHALLARWRHQSDPAQPFAASWHAAIRAAPVDPARRLGLLRLLDSAGRHAEMAKIAHEAVSACGPLPSLLAMRAVAASELGLLDEAEALFARLPDDDPGLAVRRLRLMLRGGRHAAAAEVGERWATRADGQAVWPYLALAWRLNADPRADWLEAEPLVGVHDLGLSAGELAEIADALRRLHRERVHPFDQSLRGGTQTDGALFARRDPAIARLRSRLEGALLAHIGGLPDDPAHPVLRRRRASIGIAGSWSVRLTDDGFHLAHVHGAGWFSSACYIALPPGDPGALVLGEPPAELGLQLAPRRMIIPRPGRLVLFPSMTWHATRRFARGERLTVAFDAVPV